MNSIKTLFDFCGSMVIFCCYVKVYLRLEVRIMSVNVSLCDFAVFEMTGPE